MILGPLSSGILLMRRLREGFIGGREKINPRKYHQFGFLLSKKKSITIFKSYLVEYSPVLSVPLYDSHGVARRIERQMRDFLDKGENGGTTDHLVSREKGCRAKRRMVNRSEKTDLNLTQNEVIRTRIDPTGAKPNHINLAKMISIFKIK